MKLDADIINVKRNRGFTLVETVFVLLIGSMILMFFMSALNSEIRENKRATTSLKLAEIDKNIQRFLEEKGRLPCVASLMDSVNNPNFATELVTAVVGEGGCDPVAPPGTMQAAGVRFGMVPTRTLNLPDDYVLDGWGGRIMYAVTRIQAQAGDYTVDGGVIDVRGRDDSIILANNIDYVLVSFGPENNGAYGLSGGPNDGAYGSAGSLLGNCTDDANELEKENCDMDDARFRSGLFFPTTDIATSFDDFVSYQSNIGLNENIIPSNATLYFQTNGISVCPVGWIRTNPQPTVIDAATILQCRKV